MKTLLKQLRLKTMCWSCWSLLCKIPQVTASYCCDDQISCFSSFRPSWQQPWDPSSSAPSCNGRKDSRLRRLPHTELRGIGSDGRSSPINFSRSLRICFLHLFTFLLNFFLYFFFEPTYITCLHTVFSASR